MCSQGQKYGKKKKKRRSMRLNVEESHVSESPEDLDKITDSYGLIQLYHIKI